MYMASIVHSPLLFLLFYIPLQIVTLWDFHVLWLLERWQQRHGRHVRIWFQALGEFEALNSLAGLAHDNPDWAFPEIDESSSTLVARGLGHPLIHADFRIGNDVKVGPRGTFLLVTGSNMSGKSTLLRSLGTNVVLAQAGGPVCAAHMRMPPVLLATSMRVRDSVVDGVSFFMAELQRLKVIVQRAHSCAERENGMLLYLLDEILQGTNSRERHIAVAQVVGHLLDCGAIGAISTHDLELAGNERLADSCRAVHFRETLHYDGLGLPMTFDFKLRKGIATTTNALKLLEILGLTQDRPDSDRGEPRRQS